MKVKKWLLGLCLLFGLATLSVCSFSDGLLIGKTQREIQDAAFSDKGRVEVPEDSYTIGTLGGRKVRMSSYQVQDVSYTDTPTAFSKDWETYKAPPRTYDSVLAGFDFYLNYETGVIRDIRHDDGFYDELKASDTPWVFVGVGNNLDSLDKSPTRWDDFVAMKLRESDQPHDQYVRVPEKEYGLEKYIVKGSDPETSIPYRERVGKYGLGKEDIFVAWDKDGHINTYISCGNYPYSLKIDYVVIPQCSHKFVIHKDIDVTLSIGYDRKRIRDWRKIENEAMKAVWSFVAAADADRTLDAHKE